MFGLSLVSAGIYDLKYRKIPGWTLIPILVFGFIFNNTDIYERIAGFICPALPLFIVALNNPNIKGGDIKYLAALGLGVGIDALCIIIFFALCISLVYSGLTKRKSVPLAFVCLVGFICWRCFL